MPLKNKDGTPYELKKPNPLMLNQDVEEEGWIIVHNFNKEEEIINYKKPVQPPKQKVEAPILTDPIPEPTPEPEPEPVLNVEPPQVTEEERENASFCYCLPAEIKYVHDKLYGESRAVVKYGEKFSFEAIIANRDEMNFVMLTNVLLPTHSIIYIREDRRWWRVTKTLIRDNGGYLVSCIPSVEKPSFN